MLNKSLIVLIFIATIISGCSSPDSELGIKTTGKPDVPAISTQPTVTNTPTPSPTFTNTPPPSPAPKPTIKVVEAPPPPPPVNEPSYACNCSKTCKQMSSCAEAQYQLNVCGCSARDGDHDGVACDADCQ